MEYDLNKTEGARAFGDDIAELIRSKKFDQAEAFLRQFAGQYPSKSTELALAISATQVRITGWDEFNIRIKELSRTSEPPITGVLVNISNYTDDAADGLRHPALEIGYLQDGTIAYSRQDEKSLLEMSRLNKQPWNGDAHYDGYELSISGLQHLNDWLIKKHDFLGPTHPTRDAIADKIAEWFLILHYHRATRDALQEHGLVMDIPIIVGSHDFGPLCETFLYRSKPFAVDDATLEARDVADKLERQRVRDEWLAETIARFMQQRQSVTLWPADHNPRQRAVHFESASAQNAMTLKAIRFPLPQTKEVWEMREDEFQDFLMRFRHHHDPERYPLARPREGILRRILPTGFGRKGI